jgi:glycerophosphoryl diester phosphodiesterase
VEIDLRYTKDGEVVLFHDETLERTTNGAGRLADMTLSELLQLDAGNGARIPTLKEVIARTRGRIQLYLDLKEMDPMPVVRLIQEAGAGGIVYFRPYSFTALQRVVSADPAFRVLVDLNDWMQIPGLFDAIRQALPTAAFSGDLRIWTADMLEEARRLGIETFANVLGTEDTAANRRRAVQMGFDYIQTDDQADLLKARQEQE